MKKVVCEICAKSYSEGKSYMDHLKRMHGIGENGAALEEDIKCEGCYKTFKSSQFYKKHYRLHHTFVTCDICGKKVSQNGFKRHKLQNHSASEADKPFLCTVCSPHRGFVTRHSYKEHMFTHTGERPYKCQSTTNCTATFKSNANQFKHFRESHREEYFAKQAAKLKAKRMME